MVSSIMVIAVNLIAISGLMKSSILQSPYGSEQVQSEQDENVLNTSQHSTLTPVFEKVKAYVEESEIYKNQHLKLSDLSQVLNISEKQISQAVNECFGQNINFFINSYRIKLAENMLHDPSFN